MEHPAFKFDSDRNTVGSEHPSLRLPVGRTATAEVRSSAATILDRRGSEFRGASNVTFNTNNAGSGWPRKGLPF